MSIILAIDLGKFKSVACIYQTTDGSHEFRTIRTTPAEVHDLIVQIQPGRVVIEIGSAAGGEKARVCAGLFNGAGESGCFRAKHAVLMP